MYWDARFPRLISDEQVLWHSDWLCCGCFRRAKVAGLGLGLQMRDLYHNPKNHLLAIADISADPYGSIQATRECTKIDKPFLVHNPDSDLQVGGPRFVVCPTLDWVSPPRLSRLLLPSRAHARSGAQLGGAGHPAG
jgi:hypothetical protein